MAALLVRSRVVGNLVSLETGAFENRLGGFIERRPSLFAGGWNLIAEKRRSGLDGQLIDRQMIAGQVQGRAKVLFPLFRGLTGKAVDQIEGKPWECPGRQVYGANGFRRRM